VNCFELLSGKLRSISAISCVLPPAHFRNGFAWDFLVILKSPLVLSGQLQPKANYNKMKHQTET